VTSGAADPPAGGALTVDGRSVPFAAGDSSVNSVAGSSIGIMPVSSRTVATQMRLLPDIGGYSVCSMITNPASASGCVGGRTRLQHRPG
jgi:hypothetical protein